MDTTYRQAVSKQCPHDPVSECITLLCQRAAKCHDFVIGCVDNFINALGLPCGTCGGARQRMQTIHGLGVLQAWSSGAAAGNHRLNPPSHLLVPDARRLWKCAR